MFGCQPRHRHIGWQRSFIMALNGARDCCSSRRCRTRPDSGIALLLWVSNFPLGCTAQLTSSPPSFGNVGSGSEVLEKGHKPRSLVGKLHDWCNASLSCHCMQALFLLCYGCNCCCASASCLYSMSPGAACHGYEAIMTLSYLDMC